MKQAVVTSDFLDNFGKLSQTHFKKGLISSVSVYEDFINKFHLMEEEFRKIFIMDLECLVQVFKKPL